MPKKQLNNFSFKFLSSCTTYLYDSQSLQNHIQKIIANKDQFVIIKYYSTNGGEVVGFLKQAALNSVTIILENGTEKTIPLSDISFANKQAVEMEYLSITTTEKDISKLSIQLLQFNKMKFQETNNLVDLSTNVRTENLSHLLTSTTQSAFTAQATQPSTTIYLTPDEIKKMPPQQIKKNLSDANFLAAISDYTFKDLIVTSHDVVEFVLKNSTIRSRLNAIDGGFDTQTFTHSCTARTLMKALYELKIINEYSRSKELDIYSQTCTSLGSAANPLAIMKYLNQFKKDLNVVAIQIDSITNKLLPLSTLKQSTLLSSHSVFSTLPNIKHFQTFEENDFPEDTPTLMVVTGSLDYNQFSSDGHVIFCIKNQGKYSTYEPGQGTVTQYNSLQNMLDGEKSVGVFFELTKTGLGRSI